MNSKVMNLSSIGEYLIHGIIPHCFDVLAFDVCLPATEKIQSSVLD
jgi:hypothetical protein